jgi:hypothetical protein
MVAAAVRMSHISNHPSDFVPGFIEYVAMDVQERMDELDGQLA